MSVSRTSDDATAGSTSALTGDEHVVATMAARRPPLQPDTLIDVPGYRVRGILGMGGFGTVWDAVRERDGHPVAIKTVHPDHLSACERLVREADALRKIGPPHVPAFYEEGTLADGAPYFVCERLDIPSLSASLGQPLDIDEFLSLVAPILSALQAVHERGLLHRDLKPDNIFVSRDRTQAKLIDFGLTKVLREPSASLSRSGSPVPPTTTAGMVLGTPLYMSPEQCEGSADVDQRTDIYALGVLFYEILTGSPPFAGDPAAVRIAHIGQRPAPMSRTVRVPRSLDQLVAECLAKAPERRPPNVWTLRARLDDIAARHGLEATGVETRDTVVAAPPRARVAATEHTIALLYFETHASTNDVQDALAGFDGRLASIQGVRCVAAFGVESRDNPIDLALDAAAELIERKLVTHVVADRARARIHASPDGTRRILTRALYRKDRFALASDPPGIMLTLAVEGAAVGIRAAEVDGRAELRRLLERSAPDEVLDVPPIGRESVIRALSASMQATFYERIPSIATVIGETGYGKTSLIKHLANQLRSSRTDVRVLDIRARSARSRTSSHALAELAHAIIRELLSVHSAGAIAGIRAPTVPVPRRREFLRELVGDALSDDLWLALALTVGWLPPDHQQVRELAAAPAVLRSASARAVAELLCYVAARAPLACFIDDAHLADETALDALEYATASDVRLPIWVCAAAGSSFQQARPHWGSRADRARTLRLDKLDAHSAAELCRRLLRPAENIPQRVIARFVAETHHNPWLLTELANGLHRQNLVRKHARGDSWYLAVDELEALPELPRVEWLIERELDALPEDLEAHASLMALLAPEVAEGELAGVLRELEVAGLGAVFPLDAWVSTSRLIERGMLVRLDDRRLSFRHGVLRERVARTLPERLAHSVHEAAFRFYRETDDVQEERRLHLVAHHAAKCDHEDSASAIYLHLAEWARQRHDSLGAKALYTRALEILPEENQRMRMRAFSGRGLMHYQISRFADALDDLRRGRALAQALNDQRSWAEILLDEALVLDWTHDFHASRVLVELAAGLQLARRDPLLAARLALGQGRARVRVGDVAGGRMYLQRAVNDAEALGDAGYLTLVSALTLEGGALIAAGALDGAREKLDRAVSACQERGDSLHLAVALDQRRELGLWGGDYQHAVADGRKAQQIGRELGQISIEYATSYHLAELYGFAGELDAAMQEVARAVEIEPTSAKVPRARLLFARLALLSGDFNQARVAVGEIRSMDKKAREDHDPDAVFDHSTGLLFKALALAAQRRGMPAWRPLLAIETDRVTRAQLQEIMAVTRARAGDRRRARAALVEAHAASVAAGHLLARRLRALLDQLG